jgi:hypothetical protein
MPRRTIPSEAEASARAHFRADHEEELTARRIGKPTSRRASIDVTWDEDERLGSFILCRRCPEGYGRYFVEFDRLDPTERVMALLAAQFKRTHRYELPREAVWHDANQVAEPLVTFIPMSVRFGAGFSCHVCPQGMNTVYLTPPPYGDARRIRYLLRKREDLRETTQAYTPREQAEYVEAWDRGLLQKRDRLAGRRALARAHAQQTELDDRQAALGELLLVRTPDGAGISAVVAELHALALQDPVAFSCQLAQAIPGFAQVAGELPEPDVAQAVACFLGYEEGRVPTTNASELWEIWKRVRPSRINNDG